MISSINDGNETADTKNQPEKEDKGRGVGIVSLTTLKPVATTVGGGKFEVNAFNGNSDPIAIGGQVCKEWIYATAKSDILYEIPDGMVLWYCGMVLEPCIAPASE